MVVWGGEREREREGEGARAINDCYNVSEIHYKILAKIFWVESNPLFYLYSPRQFFANFPSFERSAIYVLCLK
jgi:hypothetical protein